MTTTIYRTWLDRLGEDTIEEGKIRQFCKAVYPLATGGDVGGFHTNLTPSEASDLLAKFRRRVTTSRPLLVTEAQADKGRTWLTRYWKRHRMPDLDYRAITRFGFVGVEEITGEYRRVSYVPVYRAFWADGSYLDYSVGAWQSGAYVDWNHHARGAA